jgi:virulence-associated protein VagC
VLDAAADTGVVAREIGPSALDECFVVLGEGADAEAVREVVITMPHYFGEYDTPAIFGSAEELRRDHSAMPHGRFVIRSGNVSTHALSAWGRSRKARHLDRLPRYMGRNGNSRAVRIPSEFRLESDRVAITRNARGELVIRPIPVARGEAFLLAISAFDDDDADIRAEDRREQPAIQERGEL